MESGDVPFNASDCNPLNLAEQKKSRDSEDGSEPDDLFGDQETNAAADDDDDDDISCNGLGNNDLFITVTDPKKHVGSMETYISYKVTTKTTRSAFDNSEYEVYHRYTDFLWVRSRLEEDHPTHLIPPLPAKFVVKGMMDRFSSDFVETRCRALHKFMQRLSDHPVLSCNDSLKTFLTAKAPEFTTFRKQSEGFMARVGDSMRSIATSAAAARPKECNAEFDDISDDVTLFGDKMNVLVRVAERLLEEKRGFVGELNEYAPTFAAWAGTEDDAISPVLTALSSCVESCAKFADQNTTDHENAFLPPLREYILYADAVKQVLRKRDAYEAQHERAVNELHKKKEEHENLPNSDQSYSFGAMMGKNVSEVREQKEKKLEQQLHELSKSRDEMCDRLEFANSNLRADLERWKQHKLRDVAHVFEQHATGQISYHQQCLEAWESFLPQITLDNENADQVEDMFSSTNDGA